MNVEKLRLRAMERAWLQPTAQERVADCPLPAEIAWPTTPANPPSDPPTLEALAEHVPEECFYVRFGKFSNYIWLRKLIEQAA